MAKSVKLPTKNTTHHVARHQQPQGAINAKGFKKITDKTTGHDKWIDAKKPMALDTDGDPTHKRY